MTLHAFLMRRIAHVVFLLGLTLTSAAVHAQGSAETPAPTPIAPRTPDETLTTSAPRTPEAGPRLQPVALQASVVSARVLAPAPVPLPRRAPRVGAPVAMIGVGLAAIIAGSIVGGDSGTIIAVTGAAVGLAGLYVYLR